MNKSIKIILNYFLGPVLFILLSYSLYKQLVNQPDLEFRWVQIKENLTNPLFAVVIMMAGINWGLESVKWIKLMKPMEKMNFFNAFRSVLAGCSITMITPNRTGEFGGRILFVKPENRINAVSSAVLGSISQLCITFITGTVAVIYFRFYSFTSLQFSKISWIFSDLLVIISFTCTCLLLFTYFKIPFLYRLLKRFPLLKKWIHYVETVGLYENKDLLRILFYSFLRYLVFILQFVLMLRLMNVELRLELMIMLLAVFYLMMAIVPTIGFIELPVRAKAGIMIIGIFSDNVLGIGSASLGIWVLNLVIPSMLGGVFMIANKIFR